MRKLHILGIASAVLGIAAFAAPAHAASYDGVCNSSSGGEICLYRDKDAQGPIYDTLYSKPSYTGTYYGTGISINDSVTSIKNLDPDTDAMVFTNANYTGDDSMIWSGATFHDMGYGSPWMDNSISSHCFINNSACPY
ncbi:peptidase inhibitor family I36 protein [Streptomyces sp. NBC_00572]|uniref:peptidase inhibitor family I36 protein n=1 Tax=Streptomyces sp. NBC_00572 TaxID=2903664 RepID=UPI00224E3796|nr:peptidase inhibitor family I36 protein [Streptomyces sp. NBC_00572]MCX4979635.1 peptidase inhibitor family I36 protein [Streptomyces sp. NBC_00572]